MCRVKSFARRSFTPPMAIARPVRADPPTAPGDGRLKPAKMPGDEASEFSGSREKHGLLGIPVEMLAEICAYLEPLDLRSMSMTNQAFRRILMSVESRQMWKSARIGTYGNMPECPEDMSEPQYVQFLFNPECFTCDKLAVKIDLVNRVKSCAGCYKKNHLTKLKAVRAHRGFSSNLMFPPEEAKKAAAKRYYRFRVRADHDRYKSILESTPDQRAAFENDVALRAARSLKSSNAILEWMRKETDKQNRDRYTYYQSRKRSIVKRMIEAGHDPVDIGSPCIDPLMLHDMTDEEWTVMQPSLEDMAAQNKARRMARTSK